MADERKGVSLAPAACGWHTGLGHSSEWQQMPLSTLGPSSGLGQEEKPPGLAMGEGFSGHRWEWWVWALWQGLIAGGRMVPARKQFSALLQW